ncbi:MAG: protein tyrosine phosphatase [Deltaproteobacteria bacterium]
MSADILNRMTFGQRLAAHFHAHLRDHAFFRVVWTNMAEIAPGVWRSNQPSPALVRRYADMGLRAILNLRGTSSTGSHSLEVTEAVRQGIPLHSHALGSRSLSPRATYLALLDDFEIMPRPFVLHCKSGADRAGLGSAFWLIHMEGLPVTEARRMLSLRFLHVKRSKTGVLDGLLDAYAAHCEITPISLRDWLTHHYDREAITAACRGDA